MSITPIASPSASKPPPPPEPTQIAPIQPPTPPPAPEPIAPPAPVSLEPKTEASDWIDSSAKRVSRENDVTAYTDAVSFYTDLAATLVREAEEGAVVFLLGWSCVSNFDLDPKKTKTTLIDVLTACSAKKAKVRAMIWSNFVAFEAESKAAVDAINKLSNGAALFDQRTNVFGSHHQKVIGIIKEGNAIAYCGGMDINTDRIRQTIPSAPLHDTHLKVRGPAAVHLAEVFEQRWKDHPSASSLALPKVTARFTAPFTTQVGLTYPRIDDGVYTMLKTIAASQLKKHPQLQNYRLGDMLDRSGKFRPYAFAASGDTSALTLILRAIATASTYIYLEDQYLVSRDISQALAKRLKQGQVKIVILLCHPDAGIDIAQVWQRHKEFIDDLAAADPGRRNWVATYLKQAGQPPPYALAVNTYVHSKCWIFDDQLAIIGSANCSRRSYTYDSEAVVAVHGAEKPGQRKTIDGQGVPWPTFAKEFRIALWAKHLARKPREVIDPARALPLWFAPPNSSRIAKYNENQKTDPPPTYQIDGDLVWSTLVDPDGR